jgi:hypothetical protein
VGACLGAGLGHADQVRSEEGLDIAGIGIAEAFEVTLFQLRARLHDCAVAVLFRGLSQDLSLDGLQALLVGATEKIGVGDCVLAVSW